MSASPQLHPPASPTYILRGHAAPIHALHIFHQNLRIISGDAEGWTIVWDLVSKRPVAVWKAHHGAILEVKGFSLHAGNLTEVYTHGRDHKLCVWRFRTQDEAFLQKTLPVDAAPQSQPTQPWLVHSLPVNALNFCAFSMLVLADQTPEPGDPPSPSAALIAVPNALDSGAIDLFQLPAERRVCSIPAGTAQPTGMVMAVQLFHSVSGELCVASAYEDGRVMVFARVAGADWRWEMVYVSRAHSQPVLSIDVCAAAGYFVSSAADARLVKHPVSGLGGEGTSVDTRHAGQQGVRIRSDGMVFATAGWDARIRVYSCRTMKELAVLKWHKEGCYAVAFADVSTSDSSGAEITREGEFSLATMQRQRAQKVQRTHWLAAGSKDGKISLWDIY
ncbi:WD repeat protein [Aspergillus coremiiformis]|uniref:ASTRA-associated protein 1 n=1 Tax=Aspergillus coremiiformis TaxID=138285 RepID=A0A5N6YZ22_9EURO|nr:WD repeat protein [Aspergillus coremiiformis]